MDKDRAILDLTLTLSEKLTKADACFRAGEFQDAWSVYSTLHTDYPNHPDVNARIGILSLMRGHSGAAIVHLRVATENSDDEKSSASAFSNLGMAYLSLGLISEARESFEKAVSLDPAQADYASNLLYSLNFDPKLSSQQISALHKELAPRSSDTLAVAPQGDRRLRVGYLSGDFYRHSVSYFLLPLLRHHDRSRFEIVCYSNRQRSRRDDITQQIRDLSDLWREVHGLGDKELAETIAADRLDLLIDLSGHTAGNRLPALAMRPAPSQVTWLGYPNTTGMEAIQYRIVDTVTDPRGNDGTCSESLAAMSPPFLCFDGSAVPPDLERSHSGTNEFTLGAFNAWSKTANPLVLTAWTQILRQVPESRLLLKANVFAEQTVCTDVRRYFEAQGIDGKRIEFHGWLDRRAHLSLYRHVDLALDTFPYGGTTTTCEALAMGVPVLVLAGDRHAGRVGVSLMTTLGKPELIAADSSGYVATAVRLASDALSLRKDRIQLSRQFLDSEICNGEGFAARFEACLTKIAADPHPDKTNQNP